MGLDPRFAAKDKFINDVLSENFNGGSPYFDMYICGKKGIPIELCIAKCNANGIALREKDFRNYDNGRMFSKMAASMSDETIASIVNKPAPFEQIEFEDYPMFPDEWVSADKRFFPCTKDNKPMQAWGWKPGCKPPELYSYVDARALSPCGWVGQNMLYQRFIVLDIDGRGHGEEDLQVIEFGNMFKNDTFTMEDPAKPGSFHLYFSTDRLFPVKHFPWAKLDFMGNAVNAAVYLKDKKWNGLPMMEFDENVWAVMMDYQINRKR